MKKIILSLLCLFLLLASLYSFRAVIAPVINLQKSPVTVVIDVGHGGFDPGKISVDGTPEKDINLEIAGYLRDYLIAQDMRVYMTRTNDCGLYDENASNKKNSDLRNRIAFFSEKNADYVISIHQNSYPSAAEHGAQVFYYHTSSQGQDMATYIQKALLDLDPTNKRQEKSNDSYYLLKKTGTPAVIVECGFLSNPEEAANLNCPDYQKELAYAICLGFCRYLSTR